MFLMSAVPLYMKLVPKHVLILPGFRTAVTSDRCEEGRRVGVGIHLRNGFGHRWAQRLPGVEVSGLMLGGALFLMSEVPLGGRCFL